MSGARPQIERILTTCGNRKILSELGHAEVDESFVSLQKELFAIQKKMPSSNLDRSFRKSLTRTIVKRGLVCNKATKAWQLGRSLYHVVCDKGKREHILDAALPYYGLSRRRRD